MNLEKFTPQLISLLLWLAFGKLLTVAMLMAIQNTFLTLRSSVSDIKISSEQTIRELKSAWIVLTDALVLIFLVYFGLLKFSTESLGNILLTFVVFYVWVEVWFYWTHRWMHESKFLWKFHEHHHLSILTQPLSAISFSFVEKFFFYSCGWFLLPTLLSWYIPISIYGIAAYFTFYYITSPFVHYRIDFLYSVFKYLPSGIRNFFASSMTHGIHHVRCNVNFGMTPILDYLFGTRASNIEEGLANLQEVVK